jgi:hypothetical protein
MHSDSLPPTPESGIRDPVPGYGHDPPPGRLSGAAACIQWGVGATAPIRGAIFRCKIWMHSDSLPPNNIRGHDYEIRNLTLNRFSMLSIDESLEKFRLYYGPDVSGKKI